MIPQFVKGLCQGISKELFGFYSKTNNNGKLRAEGWADSIFLEIALKATVVNSESWQEA